MDYFHKPPKRVYYTARMRAYQERQTFRRKMLMLCVIGPLAILVCIPLSALVYSGAQAFLTFIL